MTVPEDVNGSLYMGGAFSTNNEDAFVREVASEKILKGVVNTPDAVLVRIAEMWSVLRGEHFTPSDVALFMSAASLAKLSTGASDLEDWSEASGYAALGFLAEEHTQA